MQWMAKSVAPTSLCFLPPLMRDVMSLSNFQTTEYKYGREEKLD